MMESLLGKNIVTIADINDTMGNDFDIILAAEIIYKNNINPFHLECEYILMLEIVDIINLIKYARSGDYSWPEKLAYVFSGIYSKNTSFMYADISKELTKYLGVDIPNHQYKFLIHSRNEVGDEYYVHIDANERDIVDLYDNYLYNLEGCNIYLDGQYDRQILQNIADNRPDIHYFLLRNVQLKNLYNRFDLRDYDPLLLLHKPGKKAV